MPFFWAIHGMGSEFVAGSWPFRWLRSTRTKHNLQHDVSHGIVGTDEPQQFFLVEDAAHLRAEMQDNISTS